MYVTKKDIMIPEPLRLAHMLDTAKSLHHVANALDSDRKSTPSDHLTIKGAFVAVPVLLTLATELALKTWYCRELKQPPPKCHDLLYLFDALPPAVQARLADALPEVPDPVHGGLPPVRPGIPASTGFAFALAATRLARRSFGRFPDTRPRRQSGWPTGSSASELRSDRAMRRPANPPHKRGNEKETEHAVAMRR